MQGRRVYNTLTPQLTARRHRRGIGVRRNSALQPFDPRPPPQNPRCQAQIAGRGADRGLAALIRIPAVHLEVFDPLALRTRAPLVSRMVTHTRLAGQLPSGTSHPHSTNKHRPNRGTNHAPVIANTLAWSSQVCCATNPHTTSVRNFVCPMSPKSMVAWSDQGATGCIRPCRGVQIASIPGRPAGVDTSRGKINRNPPCGAVTGF